tara:strand:+ start:1765 stop:2547 length:783 start_codon:yes stop_codon:yes gene_type:complete
MAEGRLQIVEYIQIPEELKALRLKPDRINWSLRNSFLLLDTYNSELLLLSNSGELKFSSGLGRRHNIYGELVWVGISPLGIQVLDRLENEVIILDLNLNFMHKILINHNLYPEMAQIDPWGKLFMYSNTHNGIFILENNYIPNEPFIDFSKEFFSNYCIKDFVINSDGEVAILGCNGKFNQFSQNGLKKRSIPVEIRNPRFLIAIKDDWLVFNADGECLSISSFEKIPLPKISLPILDIAAINHSIAILTKEQILVLNVR